VGEDIFICPVAFVDLHLMPSYNDFSTCFSSPYIGEDNGNF